MEMDHFLCSPCVLCVFVVKKFHHKGTKDTKIHKEGNNQFVPIYGITD